MSTSRSADGRVAGAGHVIAKTGRFVSVCAGILVNVGILLQAQVQAVAARTADPHGLDRGAFLALLLIVGGFVLLMVGLIANRLGGLLAGRVSPSLRHRVEGWSRRFYAGLALVTVGAPLISIGTTTVLGPDSFWLVLLVVLGTYLAGVWLVLDGSGLEDSSRPVK